LATLFQAPTVEKLAAVLGEGGWTSPWKALVAVQPGGSRPPLFLVPGLGGNVLTFVHLANLLGPDQPLYGFQSRGLDGNETPYTEVEEIAEFYLHELRQFRPVGPYLLGGACMGGAVAFEIAQRLVAAGEKVDLLVFVEPSRLLAVGSESKMRILTIGASVLTKLLSVFGPVVYLVQRLGAHLRSLLRLNVREWIPYVREKTSTVKEMIQQQDVFRGDSDFVNQENVLNANFGAMRSYEPKVYPGPINIILASERPVRSKHDARLNWIDYSGGDHLMEHIAVKDSGDMFIEPFVHELAAKLAAILKKNGSSVTDATSQGSGDNARK
jgi:pimeloyl-ACP methyl ester carboxylesterase